MPTKPDVPSKDLHAQSLGPKVDQSFAELFKFQFVLAKSPPRTCNSWVSASVGDWTLQTCPSLRTVAVLDEAGADVGRFIGIGVTGQGEAITQHLVIHANQNDRNFMTIAESQIMRIAGRYTVILSTPDAERMYFDPALDQSVTYNTLDDLIASSVSLAIRGDLQENTLFDGEAILTKDLYYAFQHTSDFRVKRAIPNHFLDLRTFTLHRHWPRDFDSFTVAPNDRAGIFQQMHQRLSGIMAALIDNFDCSLPITGGRDSRLLLSCANDKRADISSVFTHATNYNSLIDAAIGSKVADAFGLDHTIFNIIGGKHNSDLSKDANQRRFLEFAFKTGFQSATRDSNYGLAHALAPETEVLLRGNLLGILSAQQYRRPMIDRPFDLDYALSRLRISDSSTAKLRETWGAAYLGWMKTLPESAKARVYDIAFLELVQPHALGGLMSGFTRSFHVNPFNDRFLLHCSARIHPRYRIRGKAMAAMQKRAAPELAEIPYTSDLKWAVGKALGKPTDVGEIVDHPSIWAEPARKPKRSAA